MRKIEALLFKIRTFPVNGKLEMIIRRDYVEDDLII